MNSSDPDPGTDEIFGFANTPNLSMNRSIYWMYIDEDRPWISHATFYTKSLKNDTWFFQFSVDPSTDTAVYTITVRYAESNVIMGENITIYPPNPGHDNLNSFQLPSNVSAACMYIVSGHNIPVFEYSLNTSHIMYIGGSDPRAEIPCFVVPCSEVYNETIYVSVNATITFDDPLTVYTCTISSAILRIFHTAHFLKQAKI